MRAVKLIIGSLFALAIIGCCGFLTYFFITASYLPPLLAVSIAAVCAVAVFVTFYLWINSSVNILRDDAENQIYRGDE